MTQTLKIEELESGDFLLVGRSFTARTSVLGEAQDWACDRAGRTDLDWFETVDESGLRHWTAEVA